MKTMPEFNGYSEKMAVGIAMATYGGSFTQHLGWALQHADSQNAEKIRKTWPGLWHQYKDMAGKMSMFQGES